MNFPVDLPTAMLAFSIATLGATLQGSIGFGLGLIGVPLLVMLNPVFVPGPVLLVALCLTSLISLREHRAINFREITWAVAGRILGAVIGVGLLNIISENGLSLFFGSMVLLAVLISISGWKLSLRPLNLLGAGTISGIMGTTSAIGGAPMAIVYQHQEGPRLRGSLSSIFIFGTIISLTSLILAHRFGLRELQLALVLLPGTLLGFIMSRKTARFLDRGFIRPAVLIASALSGLIVILRVLTG